MQQHDVPIYRTESLHTSDCHSCKVGAVAYRITAMVRCPVSTPVVPPIWLYILLLCASLGATLRVFNEAQVHQARRLGIPWPMGALSLMQEILCCAASSDAVRCLHASLLGGAGVGEGSL